MRSKGFTLVELLVVISIIGVLASLALVSFTSSQKQARDTQRKSDIKQYSTSLENFANKNAGLYPAENAATAADGDLCTDLGLADCPADPKDGTGSFGYKYQSDGSLADGSPSATAYILWAELENLANNYWVLCSNGKVGVAATAPQSATCPL